MNNIFKGGKHLEKGLKKLQKIDFEKYTGTDSANIKVNHYNDRPTEVFVNGEKIKLIEEEKQRKEIERLLLEKGDTGQGSRLNKEKKKNKNKK